MSSEQEQQQQQPQQEQEAPALQEQAPKEGEQQPQQEQGQPQQEQGQRQEEQQQPQQQGEQQPQHAEQQQQGGGDAQQQPQSNGGGGDEPAPPGEQPEQDQQYGQQQQEAQQQYGGAEGGQQQQQQDVAAAMQRAQEMAAKFADGKRPREGEDGQEEGDAKRQNTTEGLQGQQVEGPDGQVTFTLMCAPEKVGRIIGKAGVTIKELEARTGVRVQVDHKVGTPEKPIHLIGAAQAVEACKGLVHEVLTSETGSLPATGGETTRRVPCPPGIVGRIIGRGGETIRSLQSGSGAHILVDQNFPPEQNREVIISGRADNVERAYRMVSELVSGDPGSAQQIIQKVLGSYGVGTTRTVDCPKTVVGRVIGKGGETIKGLQKQFSTSVQIDQSVNPCKITVAGPPPAVMACAGAIEDIMEDRPSMGMGMGMGMGRPPFNPMFGGAPYGAPPYGAAAAAYGASPYGAAPAYGGFGGPAAYPPTPAAASPYGAMAPAPYVPPYSQPPAAYGGYGADPYAAAAGYAAATPAAAAPAMPSVWQQLADDQGRPYYYNSQTGQSQWEKPAEMP